ncbi:MAG: endolytic transglycosylase MltG [Bacteroidetes bacterium]|nr:endolytic transglycosylase MltG [Bacteroidota bacterium]
MKKKIIIAIVLVLLLAGGFLGYKILGPAVHVSDKKYFYIQDGATADQVSHALSEQQFISSEAWFSRVAGWMKYRSVKPGRYELKNGMSLMDLVKMLRAGKQSPVKLVIIKERTKELFAGKMGKKFDTQCDSLRMIRFLSSNDSLARFDVDTNTVMSVIMPYTYEVNWNSSPEKIMQQFYTAYKKFWNEDRKSKAEALQLTPLQVITLASIVEEETNKKDDKFKIASTYINRIRQGMKLQADPTVKFAMKNFALKRILGVHLQTNSPYNTYMYAGLPPGPICTPTAETIDAVLQAPVTDYLFFVASYKFDGTSIFTSNLSDHSRYAKMYQQELTRRMDSAKKANAGK